MPASRKTSARRGDEDASISFILIRRLYCGAGISPTFLRFAKAAKTAGETPAPQGPQVHSVVPESRIALSV
jgi:hypothetical protein